MRQDFDLHMHTRYCDGNDNAEDMIKSAAGKGLRTVGLSGHSFTPHDTSYCMSREGTAKYIDEVNSLKTRYEDRIKVLLGLELDYYADTDTSPYDYLIGSVHYLFTEEGERADAPIKFTDWSDVDDEAEDLVRFAENLGAERMEIAELFYRTAGNIIRKTDCDIIGHFDLVTKFNEKYTAPDGSRIFDTEDPRYIAAWRNAVDRIFEDCCERYKNGYRNRLETAGVLTAGDKPVFEINLGAVAKGYRTSPYPAADQMEYIRDKGGVLILSSDAHRKEHVAYWQAMGASDASKAL